MAALSKDNYKIFRTTNVEFFGGDIYWYFVEKFIDVIAIIAHGPGVQILRIIRFEEAKSMRLKGTKNNTLLH